MNFPADILRANDDLTRVIEDYRRVVGTPGEPKKDISASTSSTAQSSVLNTSQNSSNLSSLIDLDIGSNTSNAQPNLAANGGMLNDDLQSLGRLTINHVHNDVVLAD